MNDGIDEIYTLISASAQRGQTNIPFHMFPFGMGDLATEKALMAFPEHVSLCFLARLSLMLFAANLVGDAEDGV